MCSGDGAGGGGSASLGQTVNRDAKSDQYGYNTTTITKDSDYGFADIIGHTLSNIGPSVTVSTDSGVSVTVSPQCGSCHDPIGNGR